MAVSKIWVFAESDGDKPASATLEILTKARELADTVEAVYVGGNADALAPALGEYGATTVHAVENGDTLAGVVGAAALASLVAANSPDLILFAQTYDGRDAVARLSVKLDRPVLTNGLDVNVEGDKVRIGSAIFGGNTLIARAFVSNSSVLVAGLSPSASAYTQTFIALLFPSKMSCRARRRETSAFRRGRG